MSFIPSITSIPNYMLSYNAAPIPAAVPVVALSIPATPKAPIPDLSIEEEEDLFLIARLEQQKGRVSLNSTADWLSSQFTASYRFILLTQSSEKLD
jgi:hypothetical protein